MKSDKMKRPLLKSDVTVQVDREGVRRTVRGFLNKSGANRRCDLCRWRKVKGHLLEGGLSLVRNLAPFALGLLLATLYGLIALFLQKQPLWLCVYTTLTLAVLAAFSMGLFASVRANIMVMLPSLCSARGRNVILLVFASVLLSGPITNTLENTERAATSLLCGAELAANQTQELMERANTPLFAALDRIRAIGSNAHAVAGRVKKFIYALTSSFRHIARILRNVLHFLVDIGDLCNDTLGSPYRKCRALFADARHDCNNLLGEFRFICEIVDAFLPLCNLARATELFCIIPSYIASQLRKRLAAPTIAAFERLRREFDFNISASVTYDLDTNSSRSLHQVSQDILAEISSDLQVFQKLIEPLIYGSLLLLVWSYLRAVWYKRRYLRELDFDNVYISAQFKKLDEQVTSQGGASVLPITRKEAKTYITPLSFHLTSRERRAVLVGVVSVFRHLVMGGVLVALDFLVFWMLDQVQQQVKVDIVARAPVTVAVRVNGSGWASDIFRDVVASFDILQRGKITVISRKCLPEPSEPDYFTCFILGFLLGLALLVSLTGGFMQRCRRLACSSYHPERELERIRFLRQQILDQRRAVGKALKRSAARSRADGGGCGGGGGGESRLQTLLLRLPGGAHLSHLLGLASVTCLSCGDVVRQDNMAACKVSQCPGVYCLPCFHSLGNTCGVCARPLTSQEDREEDNEEELDSSDDEQLNISNRTQMRRTNSTATRRRSTGRSNSQVTTVEDGGESESSSNTNADSDSEFSEADMSYQDRSRSDDSDDSTTSSTTIEEVDQTLHTVIVHRPDGPKNLQDPPDPVPSPQDPDPELSVGFSRLFTL
ncbi:DC-STAMP domain-containing protein 2 [Sebastes umbrosus]|uniref:DC-STAMP domain-containing protein 2 n=1 Tax=Sebastes umbrosus TaxID=72105 RepID=UPI00189E1635|nr:DC-STAMP domain-containing protein 2 [Sebastes umbrosus]